MIHQLTIERERTRKVLKQELIDNKCVYPGNVDWRLNVVNKLAAAFYQEHGVNSSEPGFEVSSNHAGKVVMTTRYCLLHELGCCRKQKRDQGMTYPLVLSNQLGRFQLEFDCAQCFMRVIALK